MRDSAVLIFRLIFICGKFARGDIRQSDRGHGIGDAYGSDIHVGLSASVAAYVKRARGIDLCYLAFYYPLCFRRVFNLLANGDLMAVVYQPYDILIDGMMRNAAHRRPFFKTAVAARERQLEFGRSKQGIIKEHLVEISETVHQDGILVVILYCHILLHHWGQFCFSHFFPLHTSVGGTAIPPTTR